MSTPTINPNASMQQLMFTPGMSAVTTSALLEFMENLAQISVKMGEQFINQINSQNNAAVALGDSMERLGELELGDYIGQGVASGIGGGISIGLGVSGLGGSEELTQAQNETDQINSNQDLLNKRMTPSNVSVSDATLDEEEANAQNLKVQRPLTEAQNQEVEDRINKMKTGKSAVQGPNDQLSDEEFANLLTDDEATEVQNSLKTQTDENVQKIKTAKEKLEANFQKRNLVGQGIQNIVTASSNIATGTLKLLEGQENANQALENSVLQGFQQMSSRTAQQTDQIAGQVSQVNQELVAISNANKGA